MTCHDSMVIQWSDEDQVFVVTLPEFHGAQSHGETYKRKQPRTAKRSWSSWWKRIRNRDGLCLNHKLTNPRPRPC